ncbi:hypothetical protein F5Y18DRAFT_426293 [Xylariaceae sp. FL1019]|nr:hypothetical protein F5Y18DRAFT_426293 [Xylariaceae sp. FL1019]
MAEQPLIVMSSNQAAHDLLNRRSGPYSDRPRIVMDYTEGFVTLPKPFKAVMRPREIMSKAGQKRQRKRGMYT